MYNKVNPDLKFAEREKEISEFWEKNNIFQKSTEKNEGGKEFSFYDGPPTANGKPHIGHILTRAMKDIIPRYRTMKGYHVLRKAGWDTHGLPVELEVEKTLGMDGKQDIEKYGIEPFIQKCKESVWKYKGKWEEMSNRVGYWADMENPYITYDDNYIESVWWSLKEIDKQGLIYKGHKIVPYCPRCGTALSSHEVAQGYKDVEETTAIAKFKVAGEKNTYFLAWTTTPWTLPSNVSLCVGPDYEYALIKSGEEKYILAKELINTIFDDFEILEIKKGRELERMHYEPLFDYFKDEKGRDMYYVTCDDYVTLTDGTGIVHIAPAFGEDDAKVGRKYDLPFAQLIDERGKFTSEAGDYAGVFCKDADKDIIKDLKNRNLLFKTLKVTHSYPFCWRCDTPLLYYARSTWFIKMTEVRDRLLKNNATVNWMPDTIGKGRMANFLENVVDWGLSRERYWGTPLPIWVCDKCGKKKVIGSKEELKREGKLSGDIELHKPYVDKVVLDCECGGKMHRTPEVIDCWYDSGSMPFAQYHYPFENKEVFEKTYPADYISEAVDQTRGWFYTLMAISTLMFDKAPFRNCIVLGLVLDKDGIKMSKHKGNVVDPMEVLNVTGADAVRWYFYTNSSPWLPSRFSLDAVSEIQRKYLGTLWNCYSFYVLYAEIDGFDPTKYKLSDCALTLMDKWILSSLNTLIGKVDNWLDNYKITESARAIADFTDSLSNWYVRRCRERYWVNGMPEDKIAAYMTFYEVLVNLAKLTAPFTPFIAESIYRNIVCNPDKNAPESVHLTSFPVCDEKYIDKNLEYGMDIVLKSVAVGRAARNAANIKNRQPLSKLLLSGENLKGLNDEFSAIIAEELNVKSVEYIDNAEEYIKYEAKPQLKTLGPKYGSKINEIRTLLNKDAETIIKKIKTTGAFVTSIGDTEIQLTEEDLLISVVNKECFAAESDKGITAVLDLKLTDELIREGHMRELTSKIQTMRKECGFEVTDHIKLGYNADDEITDVFVKLGAEIATDVLADKIDTSTYLNVKEWNINGHKVTLSMETIK